MFLGLSAIVIKLLKLAKTMAQVGITLGVLALVGLYTYQSSLIYPASLNDGHGHCATPDEFDMPNYELVHLKTVDGETLQCYLLKHPKSSPNYANKTVLILSPNAGNIGHALPIVSIFYKNFGYNVFIYSYRGYGRSTGKPSENGLKLDAQRVMQYLTTEDEQYSQSSIILYGRSLGGAVSIYIAATMSSLVHALILENTFLSIRKTVPHIFPFLKYITRFVHQKWELESLVPLIPANIPVLLLSARKDEIVPPAHMDTIFSLLQSEDKTMFTFENSMHNDTVVQPDYWDKIQSFIQNKVNPVGY
ncbi:alpha/beta-hydrolase [Suhomyces tanzawaensis NRRL Y-17324]|uniref:Alpha/beta-hydrolase n=1 Tax=Suhomyces tanzawaensis NRRL Y-17324 TaxID=984487 RepID=A0A1E4SJ90_9ASCO|nr:alpha/beta-hydrolase [Suhomyces tanzawaensis NRRL Y-17324]ODV79569.1 alpha/beta-hydrolase [Suhomyces tanzawaensis NRRL Y-17324]